MRGSEGGVSSGEDIEIDALEVRYAFDDKQEEMIQDRMNGIVIVVKSRLVSRKRGVVQGIWTVINGTAERMYLCIEPLVSKLFTQLVMSSLEHGLSRRMAPRLSASGPTVCKWNWNDCHRV